MPTQEQIQYLSLDQVIVDENVREHFNDEALHGLAESLRDLGQLVPVRVRKVGDKFAVVDGERRVRAARKAGLNKIAAIVESEPLSEGDVVLRQMVTNCQREGLTVLERAKGIRRLMETSGWNASQTAARLSTSNATVTRLVALLSLPPELQQRVEEGRISPNSAYELSRIEDSQQRDELAQRLIKGELTRDGVVGAKKQADAKAARPNASAAPSRVTAMLGAGRTVTVTSDSLSLEHFIEVISDLLERARRVRSSGVELGTFIAMLRDQARVAK